MQENTHETENSAEGLLQKTKTRFAREFQRFWGWPRMRGASTFLAKTGLRGLGINADYHLRYSGEEWFIKKLFTEIGHPVCADVGANIGDYSLLCKKSGAAKVFAFEPNPDVFRQLSINTAGETDITCLQTAVGEHEGTTSFFIPDRLDHSALASRDVDITMVPRPKSEQISVPMITLDNFVRTGKIVFDFVKIDVEGYELEVLQSARELCSIVKPIIQFEFNTNHMLRRQNMIDFTENLLGYALYPQSASSLNPLDPKHYLSHIFAYQNIIAIPEAMTSIRRLFA